MSVLDAPSQPDAPPAEEAPRRSRFRRARPVARLSGLDLRNTWQVLAGALLLPLGVAVILLGWSGAAHGRVDQQQIPYLISGGVLGLAVVVIGCFFYWAHWLYRLYDQADLHHQEAMRQQQETLRALIEVLERRSAVPAGAVPAGAPVEVPVGTNGEEPTAFVATPAGTNFHTAGCPMVAGRAGTLRPVSETEARHMKPCRVCEPLVHGN